jgi:hypothetical protein
MGIPDFAAGQDWCARFMARNNLATRAVTSIGQHLPRNWEVLVAEFRNFLAEQRRGVLNKDLGNMDEVPVQFDMPGRYTVTQRGSQDVSIATTGRLFRFRIFEKLKI